MRLEFNIIHAIILKVLSVIKYEKNLIRDREIYKAYFFLCVNSLRSSLLEKEILQKFCHMCARCMCSFTNCLEITSDFPLLSTLMRREIFPPGFTLRKRRVRTWTAADDGCVVSKILRTVALVTARRGDCGALR